ncbi:hypothetical protein N0V93_003672 [Gnomoniopsis smithogilvyi]|uniref:Uncharacterized protein n=1 Tax=Gnomoniopsis smithogilvyi TaxID=1191159 RepID=A0A9W9D0B9_9PEZI|nr:hypothetical protein N0V93_003672 [Gnomoniopsis smithogilvyi]
MDSTTASGEQDVFSLSLALTAPCASSLKPDPEHPTFVDLLLANNYKAQGHFSSQAPQKDAFCHYNDLGDDKPDEYQCLLNPHVSQIQQITTTSDDVPRRLLQHRIDNIDGSSSSLCTSPRNEYPTDSPMPVREAPFPPVSPTGCVVTIHNLPCDISMRDVLARVSGGEVRTATLLKVKNAICAVIRFKEARSAQLFVHASKSFNDKIWVFQCLGNNSGFTKAQVAYTPTLDTSSLLNDPANIPIEPRFSMEADLATRCLAITNCSFELIEEVWRGLGLSGHLYFPHYTNQFEDIWLDHFQRGRTGRIEFATLHIWFNNTDMALSAKQRFSDSYWSTNMRFEADPCDDTPAVLFFRPIDDAGFAWHSNPNHSLMNVYRVGHISELFQSWREITDAVNNFRKALPRSDDDDSGVHPAEDMAARREAARTNGGFDPVTLLSVSSEDYDSDNEGGRAPPRIDTRRIEAQRVTTRKVVLPSPTACLNVLEKLAASAPSTYVYSPGTCTAMSAVEVGLDDKSEQPDVVLGGLAEDPRDKSFKSPHMPSRRADDDDDDDVKDPTRSEPKTAVSSEEKFASLKKAFTEPTSWYTVSLGEYLACNEQQHKAMGTVFYEPPEGHNSLKRYIWKKDSYSS